MYAENLKKELKQIEKMMLTASQKEAEMLIWRKDQIEQELNDRQEKASFKAA